MNRAENVGIMFPEILVPDVKTNLKKWAVIACDQFTSNVEYWTKTEKIVGGAPSTLHIIVPEAFIKSDDLDERISHAKSTMAAYIEEGVLVRLPKGVILVERDTGYRTRVGLVLAVDLEKYDSDGSKNPLIRATEQTVPERIPVRLRLREGAVLECPHTILLMDDLKNTVIGPVYEARKNFARVYDTPLMQEGGNLRGWFIDDEEVLDGIVAALEKLKSKSKSGMIFAVGDGNHSISCAKAVWEKTKEGLTPEQIETHPLRYALVEIVNLYDNGISMEPIHRVLFGVEPPVALRILVSILNEMGAEARMMYTRGTRMLPKEGQQVLFFESKMSKGRIEISKPPHKLLAVTLSHAFDRLMKELPRAEMDYIHGEEEFHALTNGHSTLGFLMEPIAKEDLFGLVSEYGVLPKKSFSIGMPEEKRYYYECRLLVEAKAQDEDDGQKESAQPDDEEPVSREPEKDEPRGGGPERDEAAENDSGDNEDIGEYAKTAEPDGGGYIDVAEPDAEEDYINAAESPAEEPEDEDSGARGKGKKEKRRFGLFGRKRDWHESL